MSTNGARRPRLLVAEDDDSLRRLLDLRLSAGGFTVDTAADGVIALEAAAEHPPDAVVCDVMMPRLSGLSVSRELRAREATRHTPIILLTARCFDEDIQAVISLGGIEYMGKPFNFHELDHALRVLTGLVDPEQPRLVTFVEDAAS